jgi:hypothetical protein
MFEHSPEVVLPHHRHHVRVGPEQARITVDDTRGPFHEDIDVRRTQCTRRIVHASQNHPRISVSKHAIAQLRQAAHQGIGSRHLAFIHPDDITIGSSRALGQALDERILLQPLPKPLDIEQVQICSDRVDETAQAECTALLIKQAP